MVQESEEVEIEEEWEFLTEDEMKEANWTENLASNSFAVLSFKWTLQTDSILKGTDRRCEAPLRGQAGLQEDRVL